MSIIYTKSDNTNLSKIERKIKAEGEKTFEIKKRFATWMSRKKETYQQKQKESALDITL